ncbi:ATP-dependent zinc metalloprotease FTSH 6 like [Actinidia chinensis var. chinensis]|uniref:ATP-dependent zinc metalloprotease FTSH 6 like n=1 Tax=Actinidia chinensis var. chinensis TaxID=1590841 RepID=A0A2R6Q1T7_ACTCC|nr:ATP-dependent zinc metalloprotease FTSH 6 like [Actinidia chinensis var. chinensis]
MTTGAAGDLQQITQITRQMVTTFGMSEIGSRALTDPAVQSSDMVPRELARNSMFEKLAEDIDKSVRTIIDSTYEIAKTHKRNNREAMDKLVDVLFQPGMNSEQSSQNLLIFLQKISTENQSEKQLKPKSTFSMYIQ